MAPPVTTLRDWIPSAATRAAMESIRTVYSVAPLKRDVPRNTRGIENSATRTQYPIGAGTRMLRDYVAATYGLRREHSWMPGRSRPMTPGQRLNQHQWGHAFDAPTGDVALATRIAADLIAMGDEIGLQYIVAFGNRFDVPKPGERGKVRFAAYEGTNKHRDHLHIELSSDGAAGRTSWYQGRNSPTPDALVADASGPPPPLGDAGEGSPIAAWGIAAVGAAVVIGGTVVAVRSIA